MKYENTPPPSPLAEELDDGHDDGKIRTIDLEGINDDIVEGVIVQLQQTGNRPHLVKELAVTATSLPPGVWVRVDEVRNDAM